MRRIRDVDVPNWGKRVFPKKVLPNLAHPVVVPFFKLAGWLAIRCHCKIQCENKKLKVIETIFNSFQCFLPYDDDYKNDDYYYLQRIQSHDQ
jgi:hypothetical protein